MSDKTYDPDLIETLAEVYFKTFLTTPGYLTTLDRRKACIVAVLGHIGYVPAEAEPKPHPAAVKEYVFEPRGTMRDRRYAGQRIDRLEPTDPTKHHHTVQGPMFLAHFEDGHRVYVFEDEVQDRTGQVAQEKVLAGEPTSPDPYAHPLDCLFCNAGEPMNHLYEPPAKD